MMKLIPYDEAHVDLLELTEADQVRYGDVNKFMDNPLAKYGTNFTCIGDGRILVVGGIFQASVHTGYGWTMVSKFAPAAGRKVFYLVKKQLEAMMADMVIHRIETANLKDATEHHRWCRLLGFVEEGPLWQYDDQKRDYVRFAKLMHQGG